jgi:AcrR family transcriptional regulator
MANRTSIHPTKQTLIDTVLSLLETKCIEEINSEEVLEISNISKGSLYHHFDDFSELLEFAMVARFAKWVDYSISVMNQILVSSTSRDQMVQGLKQVTQHTQSLALQPQRFERVKTIGHAVNNPRMRINLGIEQERLTEALSDLFREAKERGWANKEIDPRTVGVLVQAYTMGKIVDDFTPQQMDPNAWEFLISEILERVFFATK